MRIETKTDNRRKMVQDIARIYRRRTALCGAAHFFLYGGPSYH